MLAIYPLIFLALTFWGTRRKTEDDDFLTFSKMIRSAACFGIILHHLAQISTNYGYVNKGIITSFSYLGFLFTSLFFFFSGFGLITSFLNKPGYLDNFLKKRLPSVLIPFWVVNLFGVLINNYLYPRGKAAADLVVDILGVTLVNSFGWFIIEITILYLVFYFLFKKVKNKDVALILMCVFTVVLTIYSFKLGHPDDYNKSEWFRGEWWFNSTLAFSFGMIYARFREGMDRVFDAHYKVFAAVTAVLFAVVAQLSVLAVRYLGYYHEKSVLGRRDAAVTLALQLAACLFFNLLIILLSRKVYIGNKALEFISGFSLELFLVHGYFVNWIYDKVQQSDFVLYALVIICSFIIAFLLSKVNKWLVKRAVGVMCNTRAKLDRKRIIKIALVTLALIAVVIGIVYARGYIFSGKEYKEQCRALKDAKVGDEVYWGHFNTDGTIPGKERLVWIVIERDGDEICLLTKEGIDGSYYNQKHEAVTWKESDIRKLMNSKEMLDSFSRYEKQNMLEKDGDMLTLMTPEQAESVFSSDEERILFVTKEAEAKGTNTNYMSKDNYWDFQDRKSSWWWLKGPVDEGDIYAPIVTVDGEIVTGTKAVNKPSGAIRPVLWLDISAGE